MHPYPLIRLDKHDHPAKESFYTLAKAVYHIDFRQWAAKGYWNDNFICYCLVDQGQVIASVSVSHTTVVMMGKTYKAIQVGMLMTHPQYRKQGLATKLMVHLLQQYEHTCDWMYLFANETVLDFYPRFGFKRVQESRFSMPVSAVDPRTPRYRHRRLDLADETDEAIVRRLARDRQPVSSLLGVVDNEHLLLLYMLLIFSETMDYIEEEDAIVIWTREENELHVWDIMHVHTICIDTLLNSIMSGEIDTICFHFTPDFKQDRLLVEPITEAEVDHVLFVKPHLQDCPSPLLFPYTSHA